jgi:hypothetical protein
MHPEAREALRQVGQLLYDLAVETTRDPGDESSNRAELRAIAADLRYTAGYCDMVAHSAEWCSLDAAEEALARFAGKVASRLGALVKSIEERLSRTEFGTAARSQTSMDRQPTSLGLSAREPSTRRR